MSIVALVSKFLWLYIVFFYNKVVGNIAKYRKSTKVRLLAISMFIGRYTTYYLFRHVVLDIVSLVKSIELEEVR